MADVGAERDFEWYAKAAGQGDAEAQLQLRH